MLLPTDMSSLSPVNEKVGKEEDKDAERDHVTHVTSVLGGGHDFEAGVGGVEQSSCPSKVLIQIAQEHCRLTHLMSNIHRNLSHWK